MATNTSRSSNDGSSIDISALSMGQLKEYLLTSDYRGTEFKKKILDEVIRRYGEISNRSIV